MRRFFLALLSVLFTCLSLASQEKPAPQPIDVAEYVALWKASDPNAVIVEVTNKSGFDKASRLAATTLWDHFVKDPASISQLSRQIFDLKNPLNINKTSDGLCWWHLPKPIVVGFYSRGDSVQGSIAGITKEFTLEQRMALMGRWFIRPLVERGTIRISKDPSGFRLDKTQWKGHTDDPPLKDQRPIFIGIGYHPLMWVEASYGTKAGARPIVQVDGLYHPVLTGWTVGKDGAMVAPNRHTRSQEKFDQVLIWSVNNVIIPAGRANDHGIFVCPTDEEYVAYAKEKYGPNFKEPSALTPPTPPKEEPKAEVTPEIPKVEPATATPEEPKGKTEVAPTSEKPKEPPPTTPTAGTPPADPAAAVKRPPVENLTKTGDSSAPPPIVTTPGPVGGKDAVKEGSSFSTKMTWVALSVVALIIVWLALRRS